MLPASRPKGGKGVGCHYLFLLHQLRVGTVIDDVPTKDRSGQNSVNLLSIDVLELAIENEIVSGGANGNGGFLAKENKSEDIPKL